MVKVAGLFSQVLYDFSQVEFAALVKKYEAEKNPKGFTAWAHFVAMVFRQLATAESLREIAGVPQTCPGKLRLLGVTLGG